MTATEKHIQKLSLQLVKLRRSHQRCSIKKGGLTNFGKFTGKHLCHSLFFNKVSGLACNFIKKETLAQVFSCQFWEISKNTFFQRTHMVAASAINPFQFLNQFQFFQTKVSSLIEESKVLSEISLVTIKGPFE